MASSRAASCGGVGRIDRRDSSDVADGGPGLVRDSSRRSGDPSSRERGGGDGAGEVRPLSIIRVNNQRAGVTIYTTVPYSALSYPRVGA